MINMQAKTVSMTADKQEDHMSLRAIVSGRCEAWAKTCCVKRSDRWPGGVASGHVTVDTWEDYGLLICMSHCHLMVEGEIHARIYE